MEAAAAEAPVPAPSSHRVPRSTPILASLISHCQPPANPARWQVASPPFTLLKAEARRRLRATLPDAAAAALLSGQIRPPLLAWLLGSPHRTVAAFAPLPGEVDLLPLLAEAQAIRWVLPRVEGTTLAFHGVPDPGSLLTGAFGISEPPANLPIVSAQEIDVFLCPGLGFTPGGVRMGRGKGFYDRALSLARADAVRVGVTFASQILPELPAEPHDLPMQFLAAPSGLLECR